MTPRHEKKTLQEELNLGTILVLLGAVPSEAVIEAADQQGATGERIGETLVRMRVVTQPVIDEAIRLQKELRGAKGTPAALELLNVAKARLTRELEALANRTTTDGDPP